MKLKSIEEEAADCRQANKNAKIGDFILHLHHGIVGETLSEPIENRIVYILTQKSEHERALRLRLMRVVPEKDLKADAKWRKAYAEQEKAYAEWRKADAECEKADAEQGKADAALSILAHAHFCTPDCPWDGRTIFS